MLVPAHDKIRCTLLSAFQNTIVIRIVRHNCQSDDGIDNVRVRTQPLDDPLGFIGQNLKFAA